MLRKNERIVFIFVLLISCNFAYFVDSCYASWWDSQIPEELSINYGRIKSDGNISPTTLPIERSGNSYLLKDNILNYSLSIEKEGVIIDGNGFCLSLPSYGEKGENGLVKTSTSLITIENLFNITIKNFKFQDCGTAISVKNSSKVTVEQNIFSSNNGISIRETNNCAIIRNIINSNSSAIIVRSNNGVQIKFNKINNVGGAYQTYGINDFFHNTTIEHNVFSNFAIALHQVGSDNRIVENSFENNSMAIFVSHGQENNGVYHNNFINNIQDFVFFDGYNILDDGQKGNYWSAYEGEDTNGDAIGDSQYVISSGIINDDVVNIDNFPLMKPVEVQAIPEFPSWIVLPLFLIATLTIVGYRKKVCR